MTQEPYTAYLWALTKTEFRGKFVISNQYIGKLGKINKLRTWQGQWVTVAV